MRVLRTGALARIAGASVRNRAAGCGASWTSAARTACSQPPNHARANTSDAQQASREEVEDAQARGKAIGGAVRKTWFVRLANKIALDSRTGYFDEVKEFSRNREGANDGDAVVAADVAKRLHRFKTTSLSTKRVVLQDEAAKWDATLVLVAFRESGGVQLRSWQEAVGPADVGSWKVYSLVVNEPWLYQALSGWTQSNMRRSLTPDLHDFYLSYNARDDQLATSLLTPNRLYGHVLLLDHVGRIRWRAYGAADDSGLSALRTARTSVIAESLARHTNQEPFASHEQSV